MSETTAQVDEFYERSTWPLGTILAHPDDPDRHGTLVRRTARNWVDRESRPPMVRWHGRIDAEPITWEALRRA